MKLWLDDLREPPPRWHWAKTAQEAIEALTQGVSFASLDHDLGLNHRLNGSGQDVVNWMIANDIWPTDGIQVHSWNLPDGRRMAEDIDRFGPYERRCLHTPFSTTDIGEV